MHTPCPVCSHSNRVGAKFCGGCGSRLPTLGLNPSSLASNTHPPPTPLQKTGLLPSSHLLAGRYLIIKKVGQGGMGAVYQAEDLRIQRKLWAVKEMSEVHLTGPLERQRAITDFQREAQLLASFDHPNIPKVADFFSEGGRHYLVMEYVDGITLEDYLAKQGSPFNESQVRNWCGQISQALAYLHRQRPPIVFRDLKLDNIMVDQRDQIKLIDFGIARLFQPGKSTDTTQLGTEGYAPPEQYGQGQTDARSDIYALGVVLHRLLTAHDPATTPFSLPPVESLSPTVSPQMAHVVTRALAHNTDQRWQNVDEIQTVLGIDSSRVHSTGGSLVSPLPQTNGAASGPTPPKRITTRLLFTVGQLSDRQLAAAIGILAIAVLMAVLLFTPIIRARPTLWDNIPTFILVGPFAYAAARRRGAGIAAYIPITIVFWLALWSSIGTTLFFMELLLSTVFSGLLMEGLLTFVPRPQPGMDSDQGREIAVYAGTAVVTAVSFYLILNILLQSRLPGYFAQIATRPGLWISAAVLGGLGWFLGDLVQEGLYLRQTGHRRPKK